MTEVIKESYEDYLKVIYKISKRKKGGWVSNSEIAEILRIRPASVSNMLHNLRNAGFITWQPRKMVRLTQEGKEIANKMIHYSKQLKIFFQKVLKIENVKEISTLCCLIEHHITPEVSIALDQLNSAFA